MKVLLVNTGVFPAPSPLGGTETHVYHLANSLAELGCDVHLVSDPGEAPFHDRVHVHYVGLPKNIFRPLGFWGYVLQHMIGGVLSFKRAITLREEFDLIHVHGRWAAYLTSFFRKAPLVYTLHDSPPSVELSRSLTRRFIYGTSYRILNERTARRADHVITVGSDIKTHLVAKGMPADRISVIPSGVDAQAFRPREGNKARSCLFAGSLIERKGVEYLLGAMSRMPQEFSAVIAGDGPRRNSLMKMVEKERIGNRIVFTGAIAPDQLAKLYSEASFFILPSLSEGLPITILEAMSCGCPVIATRVSAIGDAVVDGYNGLLIRPRDVDDLREKMMVLLQDSELRDRMGKNARATIESTYTWQSVAKRIMTVYERVLADRR